VAQTRPAIGDTIGAILKRNGMVKPRRKRMRVAARTRPFSEAREPNDIWWCVDFKGQFTMKDGRLCYPLTVTDAASRFLLACVGFHRNRRRASSSSRRGERAEEDADSGLVRGL
jgi:transposase InsO family protein